MSESPSFAARVRAGLAAALARLSAGARHLEGWTARGSRPITVALVAAVVLAVGAVLVATEGRAVAGWLHGGHHAERQQAGRPPKPDDDRLRKPDGGGFQKPEGKPAGKPHAPAPLPPPPPPGPPTP